MARQKVRLTFNIQDSEGVRAPVTLYGLYDDSLTVAVMLTDLNALRLEVAAVTDGQIISEEVAVVGAGAAAPEGFADSDVSQVANLNFPNSAGRLWGITIPAFKDAAISAGHVNLSDTGVAALITALQTTGGDFEMTDRNWLLTGNLKDCFLATRKHRRALKRSSFEIPPA
jgi:hypothetical protein